MGIRMCVFPEKNPEQWYGDDHKLYGYWPYEEVSNSFDYLIAYAYKMPVACFDPDDKEDIYRSAFIVCGFVAKMPVKDFSVFAIKYLKDLVSTGHDQQCINTVIDYFNTIINIGESVCLVWG